jgi:mannose-6-phosphate isomerase-like protein (cupin superfamily)
MMEKASLLCFLLMFLFTPWGAAQEKVPYPGPTSGLNPKPYDPKVDPNPDMFISHWNESLPDRMFGSLIVRNILTKLDSDDPCRPKKRGAVLTYTKALMHATLEPHNVTTPATLKGEQHVFYIDGGKGIINVGGKTAELKKGVGVLVPEGLEFTMTNTGNEPLTMYDIVEPVNPGFTPLKEMLVKDETVVPLWKNMDHWTHLFEFFMFKKDGFSTFYGMSPVWFDPMTIGQPHSHPETVEEIWFALEGDITILLGKQIRKLTPGMAYKIPPNGTTPHSTINASDKPIKLFWFMVTNRGK